MANELHELLVTMTQPITAYTPIPNHDLTFAPGPTGRCNQCWLERGECLSAAANQYTMTESLASILLLQHLMRHYPSVDPELKAFKVACVEKVVEGVKNGLVNARVPGGEVERANVGKKRVVKTEGGNAGE